MFGESIWVDDLFLVTEAYPDFPGPLTKFVFASLGVEGVRLLFADKSHVAKMICLMAYYDGISIHEVSGECDGELDFSRRVELEKMPLNSIFLTNEPMLHRRKALEQVISCINKAEADSVCLS